MLFLLSNMLNVTPAVCVCVCEYEYIYICVCMRVCLEKAVVTGRAQGVTLHYSLVRVAPYV